VIGKIRGLKFYSSSTGITPREGRQELNPRHAGIRLPFEGFLLSMPCLWHFDNDSTLCFRSELFEERSKKSLAAWSSFRRSMKTSL
jgi:hypothetical protein